MCRLYCLDNSLTKYKSLPWATREVKPVDRYTNESSQKTNVSFDKIGRDEAGNLFKIY